MVPSSSHFFLSGPLRFSFSLNQGDVKSLNFGFAHKEIEQWHKHSSEREAAILVSKDLDRETSSCHLLLSSCPCTDCSKIDCMGRVTITELEQNSMTTRM